MSSQPTRHVLDGVPRVAFAPIHEGRYEFTPYPSCLKAVCRFLGRECPYHYLLGATGAAFRLVWHKHRWEGGNVDIMFMDEDMLAPIRRGVAAAGATGEILLNETVRWDDDPEHAAARRAWIRPYLSSDAGAFRSRIVTSIERGVPVIAFGVVGPPEAGIVAGYDDGGDTLIGWSMFQDHFDPGHNPGLFDDDAMNPPSGIEDNGYYRRTEWFGRTSGILTLELGTEPDRDAIYREALGRIPAILRGPSVGEYYTGQGAFDAYIAALSNDAEYPADDPATLAIRKMVHYDAMTMIAERGDGARFLRDIAVAARFSAARAELEAAADACEAAGEQMAAWWAVAGRIWDDEEAQIRATADPDVRRRFIPYVMQARQKDAETADRVETALGRLA